MLARLSGRYSALPVSLTPFRGRDRERAEILALLRREDVRLLALTGPGGIGKTRMALDIAREAAADFRHGVAFVGLASDQRSRAHVPPQSRRH